MGRAATVFAEQLGVLQYGHPLWFPEPTYQLDEPERELCVGDVGYIDKDGAFCPLFNVTFDATHELNRGGVPVDFKPLQKDAHHAKVKVKRGFLEPGSFCSGCIRKDILKGEASGAVATIVGVGCSYTFECMSTKGAMLVLTDYATKSYWESSPRLAQYMLDNHASWYKFATDPDVRAMQCAPEDIVLVSGTVKTSAWAVGAFFDAGSSRHEVRVEAKVGQIAGMGVDYSQQRESFRSFEQRVGPQTYGVQTSIPSSSSSRHATGIATHLHTSPSTHIDQCKPPENQCVFVSYYKIKNRTFLPNKIVANGGPAGHPGDRGHEAQVNFKTAMDDGAEVELYNQAATPRSPLDEVLEYILEHSEAEVAIACHADLEELVWDSDQLTNTAEHLQSILPIVIVDESRFGRIEGREDVGQTAHAAGILDENSDGVVTKAISQSWDDLRASYAAGHPQQIDSTPSTPDSERESTVSSRASSLRGATGHNEGAIKKSQTTHHSDTDFIDVTMHQGFVVPQKVSRTRSHYIELPSIRFSERGTLGVKITSALEGKDLDDPMDMLQLVTGAKAATIRINWPGYRPWSGVLPFGNRLHDRRSGTRLMLCVAIAQSVQKCIEALKHSMSDDAAWAITDDSLRHLVLVELRHVSAGRWQPVLVLDTSLTSPGPDYRSTKAFATELSARAMLNSLTARLASMRPSG